MNPLYSKARVKTGWGVKIDSDWQPSNKWSLEFISQEYLHHVPRSHNQSEASIQVTWSLWTNQMPVSRYRGLIFWICFTVRVASCWLMIVMAVFLLFQKWHTSSDLGPDHSWCCCGSRPIRGQYPGHVITLDQSETSIPGVAVVPRASSVASPWEWFVKTGHFVTISFWQLSVSDSRSQE